MNTPVRLLIGFVAVLAVAGWLAIGDTFEVGGPLQGPILVAAGPTHWERSCLGSTYEVAVPDAWWTRCLGVPYGPRRCYGYPTPPSAASNGLGDDLPLGPLREIECPVSSTARVPD